MKRLSLLLAGALACALFAVGCSSGSSGVPQPPPVDQSVAGIWVGQAVTPDVPDGATDFEFDDADGFMVGNGPFTADFQGGIAQDDTNAPALVVDGTHAWHVQSGNTATVTFDTPPRTLTYNVRMVNLGDLASVDVLDVNGAVIDSRTPTNAYQEFTVTRDPASETLIGSIEVTVSGLASDDLVMDAVTFGYPSSAANDDVACVVSATNSFSCVVSDPASGTFVAGAQGNVQVDVADVSGTGMLYAAPGESFADASTIASLTINTGVVAESTTLDLTIDGTGVPITVATAYDSSFDRGSSLSTVAGSYTTFNIFGDASTFDIDGTGAISGQSAQGCGLMGQVSVISSATNAYNVAITVVDGGGGTCGIPDGDYVGLGATRDENATDDAFTFAVFVDGAAMLLGDAIK